MRRTRFLALLGTLGVVLTTSVGFACRAAYDALDANEPEAKTAALINAYATWLDATPLTETELGALLLHPMTLVTSEGGRAEAHTLLAKFDAIRGTLPEKARAEWDEQARHLLSQRLQRKHRREEDREREGESGRKIVEPLSWASNRAFNERARLLPDGSVLANGAVHTLGKGTETHGVRNGLDVIPEYFGKFAINAADSSWVELGTGQKLSAPPPGFMKLADEWDFKSVVFSPRNEWAVFSNRMVAPKAKKAFRYDLRSEEAQAEEILSMQIPLAVSSDGKHVLGTRARQESGQERQNELLVSSGGTALPLVVLPAIRFAKNATLTPDGKNFLLLLRDESVPRSNYASRQLVTVDPARGTVVATWSLESTNAHVTYDLAPDGKTLLKTEMHRSGRISFEIFSTETKERIAAGRTHLSKPDAVAFDSHSRYVAFINQFGNYTPRIVIYDYAKWIANGFAMGPPDWKSRP